MKRPLLFTLLITCLIMGFTPGDTVTFRDLSPVKKGISAAGHCNDGRYIYLTGGFNKKGFFQNKVLRYDTKTDNWETLAKMSTPSTWGNCAVIDSVLYMFNGIVEKGYMNDKMEALDLRTMETKVLAPNPVPASNAGSAVFDGEIYVFGGALNTGNSKNYSNRLYKFNPRENKWSRLADMPENKETNGVFVDGNLYIVGGYFGRGRASRSIMRYSVKENMWHWQLGLPEPLSGNTLAVKGNDIFIVGDYKYLTYLAVFDVEKSVFSEEMTAEDQVKQEKELLRTYVSNMQGRRHAASAIIGDKLYVIGGNEISNIKSALSSTQVADLSEFE